MAAPAPYLARVFLKEEVREQITVDGSEYPFNLPIVRDLDIEFVSPVTFFVGENGTGKSSLLEATHDLVQEESQFVMATHSPILMAYPEAYIFSFSADGIKRLDYYETEHYQVMHDFLIDPRRMLAALLDTPVAD